MKTIVPIVTAVVLALALMSASAASRHHRVTPRLPLLHSHRLLAPSSAAYRFHVAAIPRWATRREEHQLVLMWRYVRTTRFTDTRDARTADQAR